MCESVVEGWEQCDRPPVWSCGKGPKVNRHLCDICSKLPRYKRLKKVWIGKGKSPEELKKEREKNEGLPLSYL